MLLLKDEFPMTPQERHGIEELAKFYTHVYAVPWFRAPIVADAAFLDLAIWNKIHEYKRFEYHSYFKSFITICNPGSLYSFNRDLSNVSFSLQTFFFYSYNSVIATACIKVMLRQSWSLMERHVPACLFSDLVDEDKKSAVAAAIVATPVEEIEAAKPDRPMLMEGMKLRNFVGKESWVFFTVLEIQTDWLRNTPDTWPSNPNFQAAKAIVDALHGVNDSAERGCRRAELYKVFLSNINNPNLVMDLFTVAILSVIPVFRPSGPCKAGRNVP